MNIAASYSYQEAENHDTREILTNSPRHLGKLAVVVPLGRHITLAARELYESRRRTVYDTWTKPYFLTGVSAVLRPRSTGAAKPASLLSRMLLSLVVNNVFDVGYQTPGGPEHLQPAITQNGRNLLVKLRYDL